MIVGVSVMRYSSVRILLWLLLLVLVVDIAVSSGESDNKHGVSKVQLLAMITMALIAAIDSSDSDSPPVRKQREPCQETNRGKGLDAVYNRYLKSMDHTM
jgi:hypothetical protein